LWTAGVFTAAVVSASIADMTIPVAAQQPTSGGDSGNKSTWAKETYAQDLLALPRAQTWSIAGTHHAAGPAQVSPKTERRSSSPR